MRILYGVSGEGFGHASHAREITRALEKKGNKVKIITYSQAYEMLHKEFDVLEVKGINFKYKSGELQYLPSVASNLNTFSRNILYAPKLYKLMRSYKPQIIISDMEPISAILSFLYNVDLISISNQNRFAHFKIKYPKKYRKDFLIAKAAIKLAVPSADWNITLSFSPLAKNERSFIASPIIRSDIKNKKRGDKGFILVYLSKENNKVFDILRDLPFRIYGLDIEKAEGNLLFRRRKYFLKNLLQCKAIISTSGFTSIGEAIYLKKPYFAIPLKGQFEQIYNALLIKKYGLGDYSERLTVKQIRKFIKNLSFYKKNLQKYKIPHKEPIMLINKIITNKRANS